MKTIIAGLTSAMLALVGYYIYEWINKRWFRFKRKDYLKIAAGFKFSDEVTSFLWKKARPQIRQLVIYDRKDEAKFAAGFEITDIKEALLEEIKTSLPEGYLSFITFFDNKKKNLGIIKGHDQFLILKTMKTQSERYKITNAKLVSELKELDKKHPFTITGAGSDWVELSFEYLPQDLNHILEKTAELCPLQDISLQKSTLQEELTATQKLFLWWPSED